MARKFTAYGSINQDGVLYVDELDKFQSAYSTWAGCKVGIDLYELEPIRSNPANRYYFGVIVPVARKVINEAWGTTYGKTKIHEILKENCNQVEHETTSGRVIMITLDTHDMPHSEFCEYVERVRNFLAEFFYCQTPDPNKFWKSQGKSAMK
ncbi:hypothetical protein GCM10028808_72900 [Spirosoma migulaei]